VYSYWWFVCNCSRPNGLSVQCACFSCDACICPAQINVYLLNVAYDSLTYNMASAALTIESNSLGVYWCSNELCQQFSMWNFLYFAETAVIYFNLVRFHIFKYSVPVLKEMSTSFKIRLNSVNVLREYLFLWHCVGLDSAASDSWDRGLGLDAMSP